MREVTEGLKRNDEMFDAQYFLDESMRFRDLMGKKSFWQDVEKAHFAVNGLAFVYVRSIGLTKEDAINLESALIEFEKRLRLVLMRDGGTKEHPYRVDIYH